MSMKIYVVFVVYIDVKFWQLFLISTNFNTEDAISEAQKWILLVSIQDLDAPVIIMHANANIWIWARNIWGEMWQKHNFTHHDIGQITVG